MDNLKRKEALERELARREEASLSTSELQARYVLGANRRSEEPAEDRDDTRERGRTWGDGDRERPERDGDVTSRRQAARITRGRS